MSQNIENNVVELDASILAEIESLRTAENASYESVAHVTHICIEKIVHHNQATYLERLLESVQGQRKFTRLAQALRSIMDGTIRISHDKINGRFTIACHKLAKLALSQARQEKAFSGQNFFTLLNPVRQKKTDAEKQALEDKKLAKKLESLIGKYVLTDFATDALQGLIKTLQSK